MNSEQTHSIEGAFLQMQIIEPWFVSKEYKHEGDPFMQYRAEMPSRVFVEYYY